MALKAIRAIGIGDVFMRVLYRTRPYELVEGSANALHHKWREEAIKGLSNKNFNSLKYNKLIRGIIREFDELPLKDIQKPRVGIVG